MPMLICNLGGEQELQFVAGCSKQERREETRHVELRVEAMSEDPDHPLLIVAIEHRKARSVDGEVERERRPLRAFPVRVQRLVRIRALLELATLADLSTGLLFDH